MSYRTITIATRGSRLAISQAQEVISALRVAFPEREFRIETIRTLGDISSRSAINEFESVGIFVKEIEEALLQKRCDIAVHSLKDMPLSQPAHLTIAAITERADPFDLLLSRDGGQLPDLPGGSRIGTSSARRTAQILSIRPDLCIVPLRGNVDTRLRKMKEGTCDAIVVAAAGLQRLRIKDMRAHRLAPPLFLPCPGQGSLSLEVREDDGEVIDMAHSLHHATTCVCITAERAFLKALGGGCRTPVGAYAELEDKDTIVLTGCVTSPGGGHTLRGETEGPAAAPSDTGSRLAKELIARGALDLIKGVKS
jgi:hydroxymethylbilane synthase